jgi:hypothetical protein
MLAMVETSSSTSPARERVSDCAAVLLEVCTACHSPFATQKSPVQISVQCPTLPTRFSPLPQYLQANSRGPHLKLYHDHSPSHPFQIGIQYHLSPALLTKPSNKPQNTNIQRGLSCCTELATHMDTDTGSNHVRAEHN